MADDGLRGRFIGFLFTSVLAGLVTTTFTYKSWREQTRLDFAKSRLADATKSFDRASQLMSSRVFYSYRVSHGVAADDDATFNGKLDKLDKAIEDWNLAYADLLQDFQFALEIDEDGLLLPYREIRTAEFERLLRCEHAFERGNGPARADWNSPSWLLAALHYCFIEARVKPTAIGLRTKPAPATTQKRVDLAATVAPPADLEARRAALEQTIDALDTHCNAVRVAGKRAIARLRTATETRHFLQFLQSW